MEGVSDDRVSGECPQCGEEKLSLIVKQGDHMRVTGGPTLRVTVWGTIVCLNMGICSFAQDSVKRDIILEFGEAA